VSKTIEIDTVAAIIRNNAESNANRTATVYKDVHYSFLTHYERAQKLGDSLSRLDCKPGDRIAILAKNSIQYLEIYSACEIAGYIIVPINFRLSTPEIAYILGNTTPCVCFYSSEYEDEIKSTRKELDDVQHYIRIDESNADADEYGEFLEAGEVITPRYMPGADDPACIIHTSGTTGRPKGAVLTQGALYGIANTISSDADIQSGDLGLVMQPLFHVGAKFLQLAHHIRGATINLQTAFDPVMVWKMLVREDITTMQVVPTMLDMLLDEIKDGDYPPTKLKTIFYSTAPIRESLLRRGLAVFGQVFLQQYGSTEGGQVTTLAKRHHINDGTEDEQRWLTSAGSANPEIEVRVVDNEGHDLPTGKVGEIVVKHSNIMKGYWNDEESTSSTIVEGFLHMGDIGYLDKDGFLYIVDRKKDMIISGGENIYPREVEAALVLHPAVMETAVIGVPDNRWGEAVLAFVVCNEGMFVTEEELIAHCKEHIASYKKPKSVSFVKELPRIATGKVDKVLLRRPYWEGQKRVLI
jgi:acyl-CoA synthetase (AMP-forming)/AMP-acid ligase II